MKDLDIQWFIGDVFDESVVREATRGVQYLFHLATTYRQAKSSYEDCYKVHVTSTQHLADAVRQNPEFKRFVHVSTVGVHGHIEGEPANENHPFNPGDSYQKTKAEAEKWFTDFAKKNNIPFAVIRPVGIYGPGDKRLLKLFRMSTHRLFLLIGQGKCLYHLIHVEDLANAMILAATNHHALGEVFICGNEQPMPLAEIGRTISNELGKRMNIVRLPAWPFFIAADICEFICRPLGISPPIYRRRVAFFTKDRLFDTTKMRNVLGYYPIYSNEKGLRRTTRWYAEHEWL